MHTEHHRPKGEVDKSDESSGRGYWWLGANWDNLLPACSGCNSGPGTDHVTGLQYGSGKGIRYPLLPLSPRAIHPGDERLESPVLLDPTIDEPAAYFTFKRLRNGSFAVVNHLKTFDQQTRAHGSIEIYGLNRYGLVSERTEHLERMRLTLKTLIEAALSYSVASASQTGDKGGVKLKAFMDIVEQFYHLYLRAHHQFLHAVIREVEAELRGYGLSVRDIFPGRDFYIPDEMLT